MTLSVLLDRFAQEAHLHYPEICQARMIDAHKGKFGVLGIIGGSVGMAGAPVLAAQTALKQGCGKVWIGFDQDILPMPMIPNHPEIMLNTATGLIQRDDISTWVIGCGLDPGKHAVDILSLWADKYMQQGKPTVWDAGALSLLAKQNHLTHLLTEQSVLTPHAGEAAYLLNTSRYNIDQGREQSAYALSQKYNAWVVLKGYHSIVVSPTGQQWINYSGHAGLATAGSGDALSGLIGSLLAQHIEFSIAIRAAVWLHGCAAEYLSGQNIGPIGLTAGELADAARRIRNYLVDCF